MLLVVVLIFFICLRLSGAASAQGITIAVKDAPISTVFSLIEKQSDYIFWYDNDQIKSAKPVTLNMKNSTLSKVLEACFKGQPFTYQIGEKSITVKAKQQGIKKQNPKTVKDTLIRGKVLDEQGNPLPGVNVYVKGTAVSAITDIEGKFTLLLRLDQFSNLVLVFSFIGFQTEELKLTGSDDFTVTLKVSVTELQQINVSFHTGYQVLSKERATGSFVRIDSNLINRRVGTNILDRLDGVTSGLIFNQQANRRGGLSTNGGDPGISIRGRSTLFANTEPLIVLDNFPYDGDFQNINPNDIETITVLKDAAAASIWGVRAGNGVIVLTSKKGKLNQAPKISFNANVNISSKPDVYSVPQMTSAEYIELENYWFDKGKYNFNLNFPFAAYVVQSPVIDILDKQKKGLISASLAESQLAALAEIDVRNHYSRYFLRNAVDQQYAINIGGGSATNQYYISTGYDKNLNSLVSDNYNRMNLTANNHLSLFKDRMSIDANIFFSKSKSKSNPAPFNIAYPYEQLLDENGSGLPVIRDFRQSFKDALSNIGLLDWNYYPYNERLNDGNSTDLTDYRLGLQLGYKIIPDVLDIGLNYQYQQGNSQQENTADLNTYNTRLMINQYAQIDPSGSISYPVPIGAIVSSNRNDYNSNAGRIQFNYRQIFNPKHEVVTIGGIELKDYKSSQNYDTTFGFNPSTATSGPVDYFTVFPKNIGPADKIGYNKSQGGTVDRFFSYFVNSSYTYDKKYTFSASARKDESNLFGVDANRKGVPLYSLGLAWEISKEDFYILSFLPFLKLRLTDGYNGNLSKNLSAYTTARADKLNLYGAPQQMIINPPNPELTWEKVHVINAGLDFTFINNFLTGSLDFYSKKGLNLIGDSPVAPQTGVTQFRGNTADMTTKGMDFTLNSINTSGMLRWTTSFLFSYVRDKVTDYKMQTGSISNYLEQNYSNPLVGRPYSAVFAYPSAGLDTAGNPQGYLDGKLTNDYAAIMNSTDLNNLKYMGSGTPTIFGSLRNNFLFRGVEFSFNITYKMGYYIRHGSFTSSNAGFQQADFEKRWQKLGDEKITNVPALIFPLDAQRDLFYSGSETLVEKGDHIRLQDIQLAYTFQSDRRKSPFSSLRIYAYMNNIGILWRANDLRLDPDYVGNGYYSIPNPKAYALGIKADF